MSVLSTVVLEYIWLYFLYTSTKMKKVIIALAILVVPVVIFIKSSGSVKSAANCGLPCSEKDIGLYNILGNSFSVPPAFTVNSTYQVKLTIRKNTVTSFGNNDMVLLLDTSSSMEDMIPDGLGGQVRRIDAAKAAATEFINFAASKNNANDSVALANFSLCRRIIHTSAFPLFQWSFDRYDPGIVPAGVAGLARLNIPLKSLAANKAEFLDSISKFGDGPVSGKFDPNCDGGGYSSATGYNGGTSIGAGITVANTQLSPILDNADASYKTNTVTNTIGVNNGPPGGYASRSSNNRHIIMLSDGAEGAWPFITDDEIENGTTRSIIQTAAYYGVKIDTIGYKKDNSSGAIYMRDQISTPTGGLFLASATGASASQAELVNFYQQVYNNIAAQTSGNIVIHEVINNSYFDILNPANLNNTITIYKNGTPVPCNGCISNATVDGMDITLPELATGEEYYIYFSVTTTNTGSNINVDSPLSTVTYPAAGAPLALDNVTIRVDGPNPYFQVKTGDVYSGAATTPSLISLLPDSSTNFALDAPPIIMHTGTADFGSNGGKVSSTGRELKNYSSTTTFSYAELKAVFRPIPATIPKQSDLTALSPGIYEANLTGGRLNLDANWNSAIATRYVVFVPGDLYISNGSSLTVNNDGKSVITFVVQGNLGIDPTVTSVHGIFLVDGSIDTVCTNVNTFSGGTCSPGSTSASAQNNSLTLNGMYAANGGFTLDRQGTAGTTPGEVFIYRPDMIIAGSNIFGQLKLTWKENTTL
jgi:hypothetical protein